MIEVLIADDHQLLIDGIKTTLENVSDIKIVAEAYNGLQVLKILKEPPSPPSPAPIITATS